MTTTVTTCALAPIVPASLAGWDRFDWLESYVQGTYEASVIWATDDECLLDERDVASLFRQHGASVPEYLEHLAELATTGGHCLPWQHAGQALTWLGY